jgi:hypothetical protein
MTKRKFKKKDLITIASQTDNGQTIMNKQYEGIIVLGFLLLLPICGLLFFVCGFVCLFMSPRPVESQTSGFVTLTTIATSIPTTTADLDCLNSSRSATIP